MKNISIEERAVMLARYIIFGISKSTVHTEVTLKNGKKIGQVISESIEIKGVFLAKRNPIVKLGLVIR